MKISLFRVWPKVIRICDSEGETFFPVLGHFKRETGNIIVKNPNEDEKDTVGNFLLYITVINIEVCDTNKNSIMTPKFENELGIR